MVDLDRQDGTTPEQLAAREGPEFTNRGATPSSPTPDADSGAEVILAAAVLDGEEEDALPPLPPQSSEALDAPPLETAAAPAGPTGGGSSTYNSDFGALIGGLQASGAAPGVAGTLTPGLRTVAVEESDPGLPFASAAIGAGAQSGSSGDDTGTGGGDDTGSGGGGDTGSGGGDDTRAGGDPSGPGADQALFTSHPDSVDFNDIDAGGYLDGTQYDALGQDDLVILPDDADEAAQAGFTPGTLFLAGSGDDTVIGGSLDDRIDGEAGKDLLRGGDGDDSLTGGSGADTLFGDDGDDSLLGGNSGDSLFGGSGNDLLLGGSDNGKDALDGGAGDDTLFGGNGADALTGGLGDDIMTGGNGKDLFTYSLSENEGNDTILDFTSGNGGDRLQIADLTDLNGDSVIDLADLDAGGHSVSGTADAIVITFDSGTTITLDGLDGTGIDSFADLVASAKVNVDIV